MASVRAIFRLPVSQRCARALCTTTIPKENVISIDTSGLMRPPIPGQESLNHSRFVRYLQDKIRVRGAMTTAEYMREALTNPSYGYYVVREKILGRQGDFVTSPEISQVFGELLGIWCVASWQNLGAPRQFSILEMGPGKGTLMSDLLRVVKKFNRSPEGVTIHLVDSSIPLRKEQAKALHATFSDESCTAGITQDGYRVRWHRHISEIPLDNSGGPIFGIGQEFLDAFPVHQFVYTEHGWRERLVDIQSPDISNPPSSTAIPLVQTPPLVQSAAVPPLVDFRFVLAPNVTPATKLFQTFLEHIPTPSLGTVAEVCGEALAVAQYISKLVSRRNGAVLFIDYGNDGQKGDTLRGIKAHKFVHPLAQPGEIDLTCDVDFSALRWAVGVLKNDARTFGPIDQRDMLAALGIEVRMERLLKSAKSDLHRDQILQSVDRLVSPDHMGTVYKAMAIAHKDVGAPPAFTHLPHQDE